VPRICDTGVKEINNMTLLEYSILEYEREQEEMRRNRSVEKFGMVEDCPNNGDIENDCADCAYSAEYHYQNGECVRREETQEV
jgi:hypothetical protein